MTEFFWAKVCTDEVFVRARLVERKTPAKLVLARLDNGTRLTVSADEAFACGDPSQQGAPDLEQEGNAGASPYDVDDLVKLAEVNPATIFFALRARFEREEIYTSMGTVLIALNPFKHLPAIFNDGLLSRFVEAARLEAVEDTRPHVWQTAARAYAAMMTTGERQSICISGESGAGKTETTKKCLEFLAACGGDASVEGVEQRVLAASPLLESFGNAKTLRNNNSSRFGKYMVVELDRASGRIVGALNRHYLLEKSRVVSQIEGEQLSPFLQLSISICDNYHLRSARDR